MSKFSGYPLTRWKGNRIMILEEDFFYIDKKGKKWLAPKGVAELNGATIPRKLWSIIGSPFIGPYRRASVVHDYFVGEGNNPDVTYKERRLADKMFFRACRTDSCSWKLSAILYVGVSIGSWSSKMRLKHSMVNKDMLSVSVDADNLIEQKFIHMRAKAEAIINGVEDFEALEAFVENEIENY